MTIYGLSRVHSEMFAEMMRWRESPYPRMQVVPRIKKRTTLAGCRKQMRGRRLSAVLGIPIYVEPMKGEESQCYSSIHRSALLALWWGHRGVQ